MKLINTLSISVVMSALALPAVAGETVNRVTTGWSKFKSNTDVQVHTVDSKHYDNYTYNAKLDLVGDSAEVNVVYENGELIGRGRAATVDNPDPFFNYGEVDTHEYGSIESTTQLIQQVHEYGGETFTEYALYTNTGY